MDHTQKYHPTLDLVIDFSRIARDHRDWICETHQRDRDE